MEKLENMFYANLKERNEGTSKFINGSEAVKETAEFLKLKLNAKDFSEAEELLIKALSETEAESFKEGARYLFSLGLELLGKRK